MDWSIILVIQSFKMGLLSTYCTRAYTTPAAYCNFFLKKLQKASKRGFFTQKSGGILEFLSSVGLIKSGGASYMRGYGSQIEKSEFHSH